MYSEKATKFDKIFKKVWRFRHTFVAFSNFRNAIVLHSEIEPVALNQTVLAVLD